MRILYIARGVGKHERVTNDWVRDKYGIDARQYADFATLRGDASDGLPGVAGVGEKTAATLLQRFERHARDHRGGRRPRLEHGPRPARQDQGRPRLPRGGAHRSSRWPATSTSAPPTPPSPAPRQDPDMLAALAEEFGLTSSVERLTETLAADRG